MILFMGIDKMPRSQHELCAIGYCFLYIKGLKSACWLLCTRQICMLVAIGYCFLRIA
jgi:hypothetical protein